MARPVTKFSHLLDPATIIWLVSDPDRLSQRARHICSSLDTSLVVSVVSLMELVVKANKGKLQLDPDPIYWWNLNTLGAGFTVLPVNQQHVERLWQPPRFHDDPSDRLLVAQALAEGLPLVTPDAHLRQYPVEVIW